MRGADRVGDAGAADGEERGEDGDPPRHRAVLGQVNKEHLLVKDKSKHGKQHKQPSSNKRKEAVCVCVCVRERERESM